MQTTTIESQKPTRTPLTTTTARLTLGTLFLLSGLNGVLGIVPLPTEGPPGAFIQTLAASGYFYPLLRAVELTAAVLLLSGRFVPLALVLLAPLVVNVFAFHAVLAPQGLPVALVLLAAEILLAWRHRRHLGTLVGGQRPQPAIPPAENRVESSLSAGGAR